MEPTLAAEEIVEWVLRLETDIEVFERAVTALSPYENLVWRSALLFQFSLAAVTAGSYRNLTSATDTAQTQLIERSLEIVLPVLASTKPRKPDSGFLSRFAQAKFLSEDEILDEFRLIDHDLQSNLLHGLEFYEKQGELPPRPSWKMRSTDPLIYCISRAVDLTLGKRLGFFKGSKLSAYAHFLLVSVCRDVF